MTLIEFLLAFTGGALLGYVVARTIIRKTVMADLESELQMVKAEKHEAIIECKRLKTPPPLKKDLRRLFAPDGTVSEFVIDVNSLTNMGKYDLPDCHMDVYRTENGGMVLHKHNFASKLWSFYLPSEKEKQQFANALIDTSDLTEL
jgi:hypothetical protein